MLAPLIAGAVCGGAAFYVYASLDRAATRPELQPSTVERSVLDVPVPDALRAGAALPADGADATANAELEAASALPNPEAGVAELLLLARAADRRSAALAVLAALGNTDASIERVVGALP